MAEPKDDVISDFSSFMKDFQENVRVDAAIPFPVEVSKVIPQSRVSKDIVPVGSWVAVRPVKDATKKTYLGIYLGEMPIKRASASYHLKTKELTFLISTNPAIFVPDLNQVVWGYESWWGRIKSATDLKQISDQDIENVWYVKALREMTREKPASGQSS